MQTVTLTPRDVALQQEYLKMLELYGDIPTVEENARECCYELRGIESEGDRDDAEPVSFAMA